MIIFHWLFFYTAGEARTNLYVMFFYEPLHMDEPVLADQQKPIYISSVKTQHIVWKTFHEWWMIGTDGESESGRSVLSVRLEVENILNIVFKIIVKRLEIYLFDIINFWKIVYLSKSFGHKQFSSGVKLIWILNFPSSWLVEIFIWARLKNLVYCLPVDVGGEMDLCFSQEH